MTWLLANSFNVQKETLSGESGVFNAQPEIYDGASFAKK